MKTFLTTTLALICLSSMIIFSSCKDDDEPQDDLKGDFELALIPKASGAEFQNGLILENVTGLKYNPSIFKIYISKITLVKESGEEMLLSEVELFDLGNGGQANKTSHSDGAFAIYNDIPVGKYQGVKFGIGVHGDFNPSTQPADYDQDHPLADQSMHWAWASGYRHMVLEAKGDPKGDGSYDLPLAYHTGLPGLYREKEYLDSDHAFEVKANEELQFQIEIDVNRMFYTATDTIDMVTDFDTHTMPKGSDAYKLAEKIVDNLVNEAMFKKPF